MYIYNKEGRMVTYYLIFEQTLEGTVATRPMYIVENKDIAIAFCEKYPEFYYTEMISVMNYDEK